MKKKTGRKLLLVEDPNLQERICSALARGASNEHACDFVGIHISTFYYWMSMGRESEDEANPYRMFFIAVKKAKGFFILKHLAIIDKAAEKGCWQAAAWKLERCGKYTIHRNNELEINIAIDSIDTNDLLKQLKRTDEILSLVEGPVIDIDEE